jgi:peptide/nickel transport system permease protein
MVDIVVPDPMSAIARRRTRWLFRFPVLGVVLRRLIIAVPLLFVVSGLSFFLVALTPGDAARYILGPDAPESAYENLRHALGLDSPAYTQYWHWLSHAVHGDLGISLYTDERVTRLIDQRLPVTVSLIIGSLLISVIGGVCLGMFSAIRGGAVGRAVDAFALIGFALPAFWVAAELIALFAVRWRIFPATGYVPLLQSPSLWLKSMALPVIALGLGGIAAIAKQTREVMLDVLDAEYIRMAWANGVSAKSIFFRHALKNASIQVVTVLGVRAVALLSGTVLVEIVFALPGLGSLAVNAALQHDLPLVEGVVVYFTVIVVAINLVIDIAYTFLNPKVRTQ